MRTLKIKFFLGSTLEEINTNLEIFFQKTNMCPGNYIESELYKYGNVYQLKLVYAILISDEE